MSFIYLPAISYSSRSSSLVEYVPPFQGGSTVLSFTEDSSTDFINPERGWMIREAHTASNFTNARSGDGDVSFGYSVIWSQMGGSAWNGSSGTPFRLDNYMDANLPSSLLTELGNVFDAARSAGVKLKIRFAYNYSDVSTADPLQALGHTSGRSRIVGHIEQLAPVINDNRDVIASMDDGFLGRWGEWNYQSATWWEEPFLTSYTTIHGALLSNIHADVMLGFRYPRHDTGHRLYFNGSGGRTNWSTWDNVADRFTGSDASRTGWYMDCLFSNQSHGGTFNFDGGQQTNDLNAAMKFGRVAATSGETCNIGGLSSINDGANVISDGFAAFEKISIDTLYRKFWLDMYSKWISSGHYAEISRRLGYRVSLLGMEVPNGVTPGQPMTVYVNWKNSGFGKVYNPRPLQLVFVGSSTHTAVMDADCRRKLPLAGETVQSAFTFNAPEGMSPGTYSLYLRLPDAAAGLASDNRYSIRLANTGIWDGGTGRHNLGHSVTV